MNNETHEDRVKILEGAPDGATHVSNEDFELYYKEDGSYYATHKGRWSRISALLGSVSSLADIQKLVDMQNEIDALSKQVEVLHNTYSIGGFD